VSSSRDGSRQPGAQIQETLFKAVVLAIASFSMYFLTRTRHFGGDDTVFATVVQRWLDLGAIEPVLFHPHHLVYNPMVAGWAWLGRRLFGSVVVLDVGAAVSAAAAALAVAGVYLVLRRSAVADGISMLAAGALAVTGGMWRYATRMEVYTLAALGVVVWLAAVADEECTWRKLAGGLAAPWLGHSVLGLLVLPGVWRQRRRPPVVVRAVVAGVVIPGAVAMAALAWLNHAYSVDRLADAVAGGGLSGWLSAPDPAAAVRAVHGLAVWRTYHQLPVYPHSIMVLFDVLGQVAAIALAALVILGAVRGSVKRLPLALTAVAGIAILIPLWLIWDVGNTEHVVAAAPLFAVLAALGASSLPRPWAVPVLAISASGLLLANGLGSALLETQPHLSRTRVVADYVRETVPENGVLVAVGVDPELRLGLPYLASRRVIDLTKFVSSAVRSGTSPDEALVQWWAAVAAAAAGGHDLWLLEDLDDPVVADWVDKIGISKGAWRRIRAALHAGGGSTLSADGFVVRRPVTLRRLEVG
jgi:hypothetical protein